MLVGSGASGAAAAAAGFGPAVLAVDTDLSLSDRPAASVVAPRVAALVAERNPGILLVGASNDGKDVAGHLLGLTDLPLLANGAAV